MTVLVSKFFFQPSYIFTLLMSNFCCNLYFAIFTVCQKHGTFITTDKKTMNIKMHKNKFYHETVTITSIEFRAVYSIVIDTTVHINTITKLKRFQ